MRRIFHNYGRVGEFRNVVGESDSAHEFGEPGPYRVTVKFSKQGGVMESNPSASAFFDVFRERGCCRRCPAVGRIVQLNEYLILREECIVDPVGVLDVVDRKIIINCQLLQSNLSGIDKRPMDTTSLC